MLHTRSVIRSLERGRHGRFLCLMYNDEVAILVVGEINWRQV